MNDTVKTIGITVIAIVVILGGIALFGKGTFTPQEISIRPVQTDDHILGPADAPVVIFEYSDLECPFCKALHPILKQVREEYGDNVAWVYRHFPIVQAHPNARTIAEASECVAELGGNQAFWNFVDGIFENAPGNEMLDLGLLPGIAESVGVSEEELNQCLESDRHLSAVRDDSNEAQDAGGRGTPYSIISAGGELITVVGAQPFNTIKSIIDQHLPRNDS